MQGVVAFIFLGWSVVAASAELREVVVEKEDDCYKLRSETYLNADRDAIYQVLTDYEQFKKFSSTFVDDRTRSTSSPAIRTSRSEISPAFNSMVVAAIRRRSRSV